MITTMKHGKRLMLGGIFSLMIGMSLVFSGLLLAQEPEYLRGVGCVRNEDGSLDVNKSIRETIADLNGKVLEYCGYQTKPEDKDGKEQGKDELLPQEALELIPMEGYWVARIEKAKAKRIVSKRMKGKRHVHAE